MPLMAHRARRPVSVAYLARNLDGFAVLDSAPRRAYEFVVYLLVELVVLFARLHGVVVALGLTHQAREVHSGRFRMVYFALF